MKQEYMRRIRKEARMAEEISQEEWEDNMIQTYVPESARYTREASLQLAVNRDEREAEAFLNSTREVGIE